MNQRDQKRRNRELVFSLLRSCARISQGEIAERANLQPSTTSNLVRTLKHLGIVASVGKRSSGPQGGKKADLLTLRADYGQFGGIYIKEDEIIFGIVDFTGSIIARRRISIAAKSDDQILRTLIAEITENTRSYPAYRGTGIAVSSIVSPDGDIAESLHFARAIPAIISEIRRRVPDFPVVVDNDANCAADWDLFADGNGMRNLVHLQVQTSPVTIGAGIVIDGMLYRGASGAAGELVEREEPVSEEGLLARIEDTARFVATFLDTEAVYIAGELSAATVAQLVARAGRLETALHKRVRILDSPELPVLGASLQAIRLHMDQIIREQ